MVFDLVATNITIKTHKLLILDFQKSAQVLSRAYLLLSLMARAFTSEFNMLALTQPEWKGAALEYREIVDFLNRSKISYAISADPIVSRPYLEQFWETADHDCTVTPNVIRATVAGHDIAISEDTIRRVLQKRMGYVGTMDYSSYKKMWSEPKLSEHSDEQQKEEEVESEDDVSEDEGDEEQGVGGAEDSDSETTDTPKKIDEGDPSRVIFQEKRHKRESINKHRGDRPHLAILPEVEVSAQRQACVTAASTDSTSTSPSQQIYRRQRRRPHVTPDVATTAITEEVPVIVTLPVQSVQVAVTTPILTESVTITPTTIQTTTIPTSIPTTTLQHISEPFPELDYTHGFDFDEIFTFPTHQVEALSSRDPDPRNARITTLETQVAGLLETVWKSREESDKQQGQINSLIDEVAALKKHRAVDEKHRKEHDTMVKLVCYMAKTLDAQGERLKELLEKQPPKPSSEEACHVVDLTKGDDQDKDPEAGPSGSEQQSSALEIVPISAMPMAEGESIQSEGGGDASGGNKGKLVADVLKDLSDDMSDDVILFLEPDYSKEAQIEALCNLEEGEIDSGSVESASTVEASIEASPADPTPVDPEAQKDKHMPAISSKDPAPVWQKTSIIDKHGATGMILAVRFEEDKKLFAIKRAGGVQYLKPTSEAFNSLPRYDLVNLAN
ncbi:hypothetical protein L1987_09458 [Smallanthus sonchifolius]|uniref:Uncharacterized protein n=1 Tax=Smallanthus sonchifolius TaxID=185202 RepID=A0ACB9JPN1_9ASTR|nr:hypothetical protein L1987_09458 [Smallanthus sonchifolius]